MIGIIHIKLNQLIYRVVFPLVGYTGIVIGFPSAHPARTMYFSLVQCTDSGWIPESRIIATPIITQDHPFVMDCSTALKPMICTIPVHSFSVCIGSPDSGETAASESRLLLRYWQWWVQLRADWRIPFAEQNLLH
jgi:hypothetical protein